MSVEKQVETGKSAGGTRDTIKLVLQALAIAMLVRIFLFQPFNIPSGSMKPTLLVGDYLFVSKTSYGYSKYSFPRRFEYFGLSFRILPDLFSGRIWSSEPQRGDVVVFRPPHDPETDFIKRVIGLPGDRIQVRNGTLFINGTAVPKQAAGVFDTVECDRNLEFCRDARFQRFEETLPGGRKHFTLYVSDGGRGDTTPEFTVEPGHYFMLGDNRNGSEDSRFWICDGKDGRRVACPLVPAENLVGRAVIIWFSGDEQWRLLKPWTWITHTRWERLFDWIR